MAHKIHIQNREQHKAALRVLDHTKGTWLGVGPSSAPVIVVTDEQFNALVEAGVVSAHGEEGRTSGKKATVKKTRS